MQYRHFKADEAQAIERLFASVFTQSEGEQEGQLVSRLARDLMATTDEQDLYGFVAVQSRRVLGAIFFSRLTFKNSIEAFILSPVAVHSDFQRQGIGQRLISHGLQELKRAKVEIVMTYGDPRYYSRVGFKPVSPQVIQPPHKLSQPEGWIGQSLNARPIEAIPGRCCCVSALDDSSYW